MGYTHYFGFKKGADIDEYRWADALSLGKECIKESGMEIFGADGTGKPTLTKKTVYLNGDASKGEKAETFYLSRANDFHGFCKTSRKPYDIIVCCFLLAFKKVFGKDFEYVSDGITRGDLRNKENKAYWATLPNFVPKVEKEWSSAYKLFNKAYKKWVA